MGKGTGLGLSMVQGMAAQSGGTMTLESPPGHGTAITLWLPQADPATVAAPEARLPATAGASPRAALTVLVVDDDILVAMGTVAMLEDLGFAVIEAHSGRAALELYERHPEIGLVITDHAMPGMTGVELARRLHALDPGLPIVLATGHAELPNGDDPGLSRLWKPFWKDDLAQIIARIGSDADVPNVIPFRRAP